MVRVVLSISTNTSSSSRVSTGTSPGASSATFQKETEILSNFKAMEEIRLDPTKTNQPRLQVHEDHIPMKALGS